MSITLVRDDHPTTAAVTGPLAGDLDESQYAPGYGPCLEAAFAGDLTEIVDARTEHRWPDYISTFLDRGALSALAAPIPAAHLTAAINADARSAAAFVDEDRAEPLMGPLRSATSPQEVRRTVQNGRSCPSHANH